MHIELSHERLDVYRVYLEVSSLCGDRIKRGAADHRL